MNILELFSCSGGLAEGFRRAGLPVTTAVDFDADARASYAANHGHEPIAADIRHLAAGLRAFASYNQYYSIDLMISDPPCTPWSHAGKRQGEADERDMLAVTCEIVRLLRPRAWLIANVPGLDDAPNWPIAQRLIGGLSDVGYCIDYASLDAASYGVPQHRVRPWWYGHAVGTPCIQWPERTHGSPSECATLALPGTRALRPWVTCRDALGHLRGDELGAPVRLRWPDSPASVVTTRQNGDGNVLVTGWLSEPSRANKPARTVRWALRGAATLCFDVSNERWRRPNRPDEPARVVTSADGTTGNGLLTWPWDVPSTTIQRDPRLAPPGHHEGSFLSGANAVRLSEKALLLLQGFPDNWVICGKTKSSRHSQIGQAMCPPFAEAVARSVVRAMGKS